MNNWRFIGGRFRRDSARQWSPTRTAHDPNPPLNLEDPAGGATTFSYTGSGGFIMVGTAPVTRTFRVVPSGGLTLAGAAVVTRTYRFVPAGGLGLGGAATVSRTFRFLPTGGIGLGGAAVVTRTFRADPSGGAVFGGAAPVNFVPAPGTTFSYVGTGGMVWGGEALTALLPAQTGTPGGGGYLNSPRRKRKPPQVPQFDYAAEEELLVLAISQVLAEY